MKHMGIYLSDRDDEYTINGHEYVDLGLSVMWATCNVGAFSPSDCGDYFAWGETGQKETYTMENSLTFGREMGFIVGDSRYDVARAQWGGLWRLPTVEEINEILSKCELKWATNSRFNGYKVIGPNGNSIFLPAAGYRRGTELLSVGQEGYYWSGMTPYEGWASNAFYIYFKRGDFIQYFYQRFYGGSVRPVTKYPHLNINATQKYDNHLF